MTLTDDIKDIIENEINDKRVNKLLAWRNENPYWYLELKYLLNSEYPQYSYILSDILVSTRSLNNDLNIIDDDELL